MLVNSGGGWVLCELIRMKFRGMGAMCNKWDTDAEYFWGVATPTPRKSPFGLKTLFICHKNSLVSPKKESEMVDINDPHATALINKLHFTHIDDKSFK